MTDHLHDIMIGLPLPMVVLHVLLFIAFVAHLLFALLTVGLAVVGLTWYVRRQWLGPGDPARSPHAMLDRWFVHKSLAVVLGVGPLLLVLVAHPVPFATAANLMAPLWLALIGLLLAALLLIEWLAEHTDRRRRRDLALGSAGVACLLIVPGIFAAVVVTMENPERWPAILAGGFLPGDLAWHWFVRTLHVIAAAVMLALAVVWWRTPADAPDRRRRIAHGLFVLTVGQLVFGVLLYLSLPRPPALAADLLIGGSVVLSAVFIAALHFRTAGRRELSPRHAVGLLLVIVVVMLGARQVLQDQVLLPMHVRLADRAAEHRQRIVDQGPAAIGYHDAEMARLEALTIYERSCSFCHGTVGNGQGYEASRLVVPPENIAAMRSSPAYLRKILRAGVDGTAMPRFGFYTNDELDEVAGLLHVLGWRVEAEPIQPPKAGVSLHARQKFHTTCAACHGVNGEGNRYGRSLRPPVPDLTQMTFTPAYLARIIAAGYPGTDMPAFDHLPPEMQAGLVRHVRALYQPAVDD